MTIKFLHLLSDVEKSLCTVEWLALLPQGNKVLVLIPILTRGLPV